MSGFFHYTLLLMAAFVALPLIKYNAGLLVNEKHWVVYLVTMLIAFISVLPFIIYAEKNVKMKQVSVLTVYLFC